MNIIDVIFVKKKGEINAKTDKFGKLHKTQIWKKMPSKKIDREKQSNQNNQHYRNGFLKLNIPGMN